MSILLNSDTKIICQGITGNQATFHIKRSINYGTKVLGGVTPGKGGGTHLGLPVFNTVKEAAQATGAKASVMYVPAPYVKSAVIEAAEAELDLVVCIADGVPLKDMLEIKSVLKGTKTKLIGPNTPGIITPNQANMGIFPENIHTKGHIGVVSRSSTLTYEAVLETSRAGEGQTTVVGLGDDVLIGMDFVDILKLFHEDKETKAIVLIGQQGGTFEEAAAEYYKSLKNPKPVIAFIAGRAIPFGYKMGYAGDVITGGRISAQDKKDVLEESGMIIVDNINDIHLRLKEL